MMTWALRPHGVRTRGKKPYIVVGTFEGLCPSNTLASFPDTPSLEGAYEY